ncbi:hypothetical protein [Pararhizobium gei]|uniref:hypothetical protein n=1 Tax=Pararhizobium gei TaxID=1395951 RepID=UPI0023DB7E7B|nr:hypothetical protein [Rhizobium gei]
MSDILDHSGQPRDAAIALFLQNDNGDRLTDILVDALDEAFRILADEMTDRSMN